MTNLFDFSDASMSWRACPEFLFQNANIVNQNDAQGCDDEEDWFFPQPYIDVPDDITARYKKEPEPTLPPIVYISGMDLNCKIFDSVPFNLADFESWEDFIESVDKHMYVSIVDADNCDFDKALDIFESEDVFDELVNNYRARL